MAALSRGRVYTLGGTGIVNVLRAADGSLVWSRNAAADTGAKTPIWGFAGSPLVMDDLVVVAASGRLVAYELATGAPRWFGPKVGGGGYSSPHLVTVGGVPQVVLLRGGGAVAVAPGDGTVLWEHKWEEGASIVQPGIADGGDILLAGADASGGSGIRRLALSQGASGWTVETRWTTRGLKPYFNDFVVHKGHAYGFDGTILSSINLTDGRRNWKGGRYGGGQMMLLADQDLLFVSSEEGEIALVAATPEEFREVARFKAVEGKTWNHPVLAGDVLLVRNAEEMVAFRIKKAAVAADGAGPATTGGSSR
jgi:outer membrane protein assembly factor BamB